MERVAIEDGFEATPRPRYFLGLGSREFTALDGLLPSLHTGPSHLPLIAEAALEPASWGSIDRPQLCFREGQGPIERTGMTRWPGVWGQVAIHSELRGRDDAAQEEVQAAFFQDYFYDVLHRWYSHSFDFLIQSFMGEQDAHDLDAPEIFQHFDVVQQAMEQGLLDKTLPAFVKAKYPDINPDRLEFGLRQMDQMGWLPQSAFERHLNLKSGIAEVVKIEEADGEEMLVFRRDDVAKHYTIGLEYLGSENWLNPLHRAALMLQQLDLKNRLTLPGFRNTLDYMANQEFGADAHPYQKGYESEWLTEHRYTQLRSHDLAPDIYSAMRTIVGAAQARGRVAAIESMLRDGAISGEYEFHGPLDDVGYGSVPAPGIEIIPTDVEEHHLSYEDGDLVICLPGGMKGRSIDPMLDSGERVSEKYPRFEDNKGRFEEFVAQGHKVVVRNFSTTVGNRLMAALPELEERYQAALERPMLPSEQVAEFVQAVGAGTLAIVGPEDFVPLERHYPSLTVVDGLVPDPFKMRAELATGVDYDQATERLHEMFT